MSLRKDLDQIVKTAKKRGWHVTRTRRGHLRFQHPKHGIVFTGSTPSDYRGLLNLQAQVRRQESR